MKEYIGQMDTKQNISYLDTTCAVIDSDSDEPQISCSSRLSSEPPSPRNDQLLVKLLSDTARAPVRSTEHAAGLDLFASRDCKIAPWSRELVPTDISVHIPSGCYGRVAPRSGLAKNKCVDVAAGVVDEDYRGPLGILLVNNSDVEFQVLCGDRIAQFIMERYAKCDVMVVATLDETLRGSGGFGSTGST